MAGIISFHRSPPSPPPSHIHSAFLYTTHFYRLIARSSLLLPKPKKLMLQLISQPLGTHGPVGDPLGVLLTRGAPIREVLVASPAAAGVVVGVFRRGTHGRLGHEVDVFAGGGRLACVADVGSA